jgi:hypothetical protein
MRLATGSVTVVTAAQFTRASDRLGMTMKMRQHVSTCAQPDPLT